MIEMKRQMLTESHAGACERLIDGISQDGAVWLFVACVRDVLLVPDPAWRLSALGWFEYCDG